MTQALQRGCATKPTVEEAVREVAYSRLRGIFTDEQASALAAAGFDVVGVLNVDRFVAGGAR